MFPIDILILSRVCMCECDYATMYMNVNIIMYVSADAHVVMVKKLGTHAHPQILIRL